MSAGRGSGYRPVLYKSGCASREKDAWMRRGGCGSAVNMNRIRWRIIGQSIMAKTLGGSSCEPVSCEARSICRGSRHAGRVEGMKLTTGSLIGGRRGPCEMGSPHPIHPPPSPEAVGGVRLPWRKEQNIVGRWALRQEQGMEQTNTVRSTQIQW